MSAVANNFWGYQRTPRKNAYLLAKRLGCNATNDQELLDFLRKVPAVDIVDKTGGLFNEIEEAREHEKMTTVSFVPLVEPEHEEAFMTKRPLRGEYQADIPLIVGNTDKEFILEVNSPEQVPKWTEDKEFQDLIPRGFRIERDSEISLKIARKIREFYFKDGMTLDGYIDVSKYRKNSFQK